MALASSLFIIWGTTDISDKPVTGLYKEFAEEVRRILKWDTPERVSTRDAGRMTGGRISHGTINAMTFGDRPRMEMVIDFGRGMGLDTAGVNRLLRIAGYPQIMDESHEAPGAIELDDIYTAARDIGLSEEDARRLLERIEEIRREKAGRRG